MILEKVTNLMIDGSEEWYCPRSHELCSDPECKHYRYVDLQLEIDFIDELINTYENMLNDNIEDYRWRQLINRSLRQYQDQRVRLLELKSRIELKV